MLRVELPGKREGLTGGLLEQLERICMAVVEIIRKMQKIGPSGEGKSVDWRTRKKKNLPKFANSNQMFKLRIHKNMSLFCVTSGSIAEFG